MIENIKDIIEQLTTKEKEFVNTNAIDTPLKLIPLLLKRVNPQNVQTLASLIKKSVLPSICSKTNDEIDELFTQIEKDVNLLFKKEIQDKIEEFINKRFERDKKVVIERTSDISKLVLLMEEYLNDAISSNGSGSKVVLNIKERIESINIRDNGLEELTKLQNELVTAAISIEKEMNTVTSKLETGKTKVQELEEKITTLEEELNKTKIENMKDPLTGLLTRKSFTDEVVRIESSYVRINTQYAVVFFDLDHFKKINDTYGHAIGDVVLKQTAHCLATNLRKSDIVGRIGGEEFAVLLPETEVKAAIEVAERLRMVTTNTFLVLENGKSLHVTISVGVTSCACIEDIDLLLSQADKALYNAKNSGRDKVCIWNE